MAYTTRTVRLKIPGGRFCARCFGRTASKGRGKMNSIKAFLKAKGLYLVCLALVFAATITGIAAIRSVVRGVEDLTRIQKQALEEGTDVWDSPDAAVNQPAQDVPVATAQPSPAPSAAGSASSSLQQGAGQSGSASGGTAALLLRPRSREPCRTLAGTVKSARRSAGMRWCITLPWGTGAPTTARIIPPNR